MTQRDFMCQEVESDVAAETSYVDQGSQVGTSGRAKPVLWSLSARLRMIQPLWWKVGGGVALGLLALSLFISHLNSLAAVRGELRQLREASAVAVPKDGQRISAEPAATHKQEAPASPSDIERELVMLRKHRDEVNRELQRLRERLACVEGRQAGSPFVVLQPGKNGDHSGD
jgi:hypothetical protein